MDAGKIAAPTPDDDIGPWLDSLGLGHYTATFVENAVGFEELFDLSDAELDSLGVRLGHRKKLRRAIARFARAEPAAGAAQLRQLTIFFSDIVGSTELSQRFHPEDMRVILERYREVVAERIARYGGNLANFLGDGVLAYFGWPQSRENEAESAVRSGLEVVSAMKSIELGDGTTLRARVGIATGRVLIGGVGTGWTSDANFVAGDTPNVAARLQSVADVDEVVIDAATRALIGGTFALNDYGERELKGFRTPVHAWQVVGERASDSRFEAWHAQLTPFVNRDRERELLLAQWSAAQAGNGRAVAICGEPGIGKSRMLHEFCAAIAHIPHVRINIQCSPYHLNTPFYPVVRRLERTARFLPLDDPERKRRKLRVIVRRLEGDATAEALFASLLSIADPAPPAMLGQTPQERRQQTYDALFGALLSLAQREPAIVFIEDLHWADPTSLECLNRLVPRIANRRVLLVITQRTEPRTTLDAAPNLTQVNLERLTPTDVRTLVHSVAGDGVSAFVLDKIAVRTDGVPLFAEELTRFVLESHDPGSRADADIPETLEASLLSRFDRLGRAKEIAQAASAIGREFEMSLLASVMELSESELGGALQGCVASGLMLRHETQSGTVFAFKHALVQDVAYQTMLREARRTVHGRIADVLLESHPDIVHGRPEVLARHLTEGGRPAEAIPFWQASGDIAVQRSALVEASFNFAKGLEIVRGLDSNPALKRTELELLIRYASTLRATKGFGDPATGEACERARDLARELGDRRTLLPALLGVYSSHLNRGEHAASEVAARELLAEAEAEGDETYQMIGSRAVGIVPLHLGKPLDAVRRQLEAALGKYDASRHRPLAFIYGSDHATTCRCFLSIAKWLSGDTHGGIACIEEGVRYGEEIAHPFSVTQAAVYLSLVQTIAQNRQQAWVAATKTMLLAERYSFAQMLSLSRFFVTAAQPGKPGPAHANDMLAAAQSHERNAPGNYRPLLLTLCAEAQLAGGDIALGLALLAEAQASMNNSGERWAEAETLRVRAELLAKAQCVDDAEAAFRAALAVARAQGAASWERRATASRSRFLRAARGAAVSALPAPP